MGKIAELFSFKGRTNRLKYWIIHFLCILFALTAWFAGLLVQLVVRVGLTFSAWGLVLGILVGAFVDLAAASRRLHDRGKSAWWLLIFVAIPLAGRLVAGYLIDERPDLHAAALGIIFFVVFPLGIWAVVELGFLRGTSGPNRYGEDPLASGASDSAPAPAVS